MECAGFCAALIGWCTGRLGEVCVGHLQVVLGGDRCRVSDPRTDDVQRVVLGQFGLAAGSHVVEQSFPGRYARASKYSLELRSQVLVAASIAIDNVQAALLCLVESFLKQRSQFGK